MSFYLLFKGFIIGIIAGAPLGPVGVVCIRRILARGSIVGFISGLGVATADTFYGGIVALGITFIVNIIHSHKIWFCIIASIILFFLGIRTFFSHPHDPSIKINEGKNFLGAYVSAFLLTLTNPMNILTFVAIFTVLGVEGAGDSLISLWILSLGVFLGSSSWWLVLCSSMNMVQKKLNTSGIQWVNRIAGIILATFGLCTFAAYFLRK